LKGIRLHKSGKWMAHIYYDGKNKYIGIFLTEKEAQEALNLKKQDLDKKGIRHSRYLKEGENYVDNKEMYKEFLYCKAAGKLSNKLLQMCIMIVKGVSKKFRYNDEDDRLDCEAYAYEVIIKNWYHFDELKFTNTFAYYTEIVKRAFAMQFKILQKTRLNTISLDYTDEEGSKIFNI
jgi:hypothetical protein